MMLCSYLLFLEELSVDRYVEDVGREEQPQAVRHQEAGGIIHELWM